MMKSHNRTFSITQIALLACLAMIFSYVESIIPIPIGIPGIKLGIANLVILVILYESDFKTAMSVNLIRIAISALLFTGLFGAMYSFAGGISSLLFMYLLKSTDKFSIIGVSMAGGVIHNLAQLSVAAAIIETPKLFLYFPVLLFSGLACGIGIGILSFFIIEKLPYDIKSEF